VVIHAIGDAFEDRANEGHNLLTQQFANDEEVRKLGNRVDVPRERVFVGLDAYKKVIESDVNYVILATPPGFRPIHIEAVINAGKNLFTEKPVAVDGTGIRKVLAAYEMSKKKGLAVVAGTQRRHELGYVETMKRIHDGAIGDVVGGRCYWNQGILWARPRQRGWTDLVYQLRNWYNFTWLCGDHIVEQHVHNLDVINWATGKHPVKAIGMGGRSRTNPDYGHIFDFFAIDYEYPDGVHIQSMARQIDGCANSVSEAVQGTKGSSQCNAYSINGKQVITQAQKKASVDPYVQEHTDLIASIRAGKPLNELKTVAESTLTAIMGRMSAYTGKEVSWDFALNSQLNLMPGQLDWDMVLPVPPVAVPGKTPLI
jgi:predicted dehydrogenase